MWAQQIVIRVHFNFGKNFLKYLPVLPVRGIGCSYREVFVVHGPFQVNFVDASFVVATLHQVATWLQSLIIVLVGAKMEP
jgi:hypothetical protein